MSLSRRAFIKILLANSVFWTIPNRLLASQSQKKAPRGFYDEPFTVSMSIPSTDGYLAYLDASSQYTIDTIPVKGIESMRDTMGMQYTWFTEDKKGQYFCPVMHTKRGSVIRLVFSNTNPQNPIVPYITGLICEDNNVGFLYNPHASNAMYRIQYSVRNPSSTCIYHSMREGNTGFYNHQGLSGVLCIHDEKEELFNTRYKIEAMSNDIPIFLQDRRLNSYGESVYTLSRNDELGGYLGNTLLVNGAVYPKLEVSTRVYKLRLVNGSNARMLYLGFRTEKGPIAHYILSTGKGLLEKMIKTMQ